MCHVQIALCTDCYVSFLYGLLCVMCHVQIAMCHAWIAMCNVWINVSCTDCHVMYRLPCIMHGLLCVMYGLPCVICIPLLIIFMETFREYLLYMCFFNLLLWLSIAMYM